LVLQDGAERPDAVFFNSMLVVMNNKAFSPKTREKIWRKISHVVFEKNTKTANSDVLKFQKNDVIEPTATLITS